MNLWANFGLKFTQFYKGKMAKISPKINKFEIWPKSGPKVIKSQNKSHRNHIWGMLLYKSGLRILIRQIKVPFFWSQRWALLAKLTVFGPQKMALPVAKSKFLDNFYSSNFPEYGPYGFDLVNLSLLGAILAIFQFCGFSGLFWPFFPCKKCKNENLSLNVNFWSITLKFFL